MRTHRPSRRTRLATAAVLTPLVLGLAACGDDGDDRDDRDDAAERAATSSTPSTATSPSTSPDTDGSTTSDPASGGGSFETAARTALDAVAGTIFTVDRDDTGGWEVSVVTDDGTDQEVDVAADGTTITRGPVADGDDDGDDRAERTRLLGADVDWQAAIRAAQESLPGGTVTGVDLDEDNGTATWEVSFDEDTAEETTVDVDASSGDVLRTERDD